MGLNFKNKLINFKRSVNHPSSFRKKASEIDQERLLQSSIAATRRTLIVSGVTHVSYGCSRDFLIDWLRQEALWNFVTDWEKDFLTTRQVHSSQVTRATWAIERLWMLAWSLGVVDEMDHSQPCGPDLGSRIPRPGQSTQSFYERVSLRPLESLVFQEEQLKAYVEMLASGTLPENVTAGIILERLQSLNWLLNDADWDKTFKF